MQKIFKTQKITAGIYLVMAVVVFIFTLVFMTEYKDLFGLKLKQNSQIFILIFSLILFVLITCAMIAYYVPYFAAYRKIKDAAIKEDIMKNLPKDANTDKIDAFVEAYALTEREKEVLIQLLTNKEGINSMIEQLYISRSSFYRYVDKLCDKTNTTSRKEFLHFFHDWK